MAVAWFDPNDIGNRVVWETAMHGVAELKDEASDSMRRDGGGENRWKRICRFDP
jgi:hypothetical protein